MHTKAQKHKNTHALNFTQTSTVISARYVYFAVQYTCVYACCVKQSIVDRNQKCRMFLVQLLLVEIVQTYLNVSNINKVRRKWLSRK